jgi:eukaryotic-like serine/threonine-protein kinase
VRRQRILGERYQLEDRIGSGGMSVVWRATDQVLGRVVAVKELAANYAADDRSRQSILAEAKAAAGLTHPHVTSVFDYGEWTNANGDPVPYVVMELLTGQPLSQRLAAGPLVPRVAMRVAAETAGALAAAHAMGIVHRDVKPGNIMLTPTGAKVFDFGISAVVGQANEADSRGKILGTPSYVAPERLAGGPVTPSSDVYALGLLLHRLLTGRLPWKAGGPTVDPKAEPTPLPAMEGVPVEVNDLYLRCVARDPERRPSARDAAIVLAGAIGVRPPLGDDAIDDPSADEELRAGRAAEFEAVRRFADTVVFDKVAEHPWGPRATDGGPMWGPSWKPSEVIPPAPPRQSGSLWGSSPPPDESHNGRRATIAALLAAAAVATILFMARPGHTPLTPNAGAEPSSTANPTPGSPTATGDPKTQIDPHQTPGSTAGPGGIVVGKPSPSTSTTNPGPSTTATLTPAPGVIVASCSGTFAHIESVTANPGYTVKAESDGPAAVVKVVFEGGGTGHGAVEPKVTISVRCQNGHPVQTAN